MESKSSIKKLVFHIRCDSCVSNNTIHHLEPRSHMVHWPALRKDCILLVSVTPKCFEKVFFNLWFRNQFKLIIPELYLQRVYCDLIDFLVKHHFIQRCIFLNHQIHFEVANPIVSAWNIGESRDKLTDDSASIFVEADGPLRDVEEVKSYQKWRFLANTLCLPLLGKFLLDIWKIKRQPDICLSLHKAVHGVLVYPELLAVSFFQSFGDFLSSALEKLRCLFIDKSAVDGGLHKSIGLIDNWSSWQRKVSWRPIKELYRNHNPSLR